MPAARAEPHAVGLDIGGTKIAGGVVTDSGRILDRTRVPTPPDDEAATLAALLEGAAEPDGSPAPGRRRPRPAPGDLAGNGLQRIDVG